MKKRNKNRNDNWDLDRKRKKFFKAREAKTNNKKFRYSDREDY